MVKVIDGNIFDTKARILAHQVNCKGVMNSGVARQVKERHPLAYRTYSMLPKELGKISIVDVHSTRKIANLYAQDSYGYDGKQYTDLAALNSCFQELNAYAKERGYVIAMPYGIGCGLGGADWKEVQKMIEDIFEVDVELWRLKNKTN